MLQPAIEIKNLVKEYRRKKDIVRALDDVSFQIENGEFLAIVGHSGSGKTTLLDILSCMIRPSSGEVWIKGKEIAKAPESVRTEIRRNVISTIYQDHNLIPVLTAYQNIELPLRLKEMTSSQRKQKVEEYLELVGLDERANHRPEELSGGEKQRVAIARALVTEPQIIFADEPTGSLDVDTGTRIFDLLIRANEEKNTTVVLVTHDPSLAEKADRIVHIKKGKVIEIRHGNEKRLITSL